MRAGAASTASTSTIFCRSRIPGRGGGSICPDRSLQVQDTLGRQILVENLSCYLAYSSSRLTEWEFLAAIVERADCGLLLDVNNAYVNSCNVGLDPVAFINGLPLETCRRSIWPGTRAERSESTWS